MTEFHLYHFLVLVGMAVLSWGLPRKFQLDGIALVGNLFLLAFSPAAAIALLASSLLVFQVADRRKSVGKWIFAGVAYCGIQFLLIRYLQQHGPWDYFKTLSVLGISYFTCRNIHYLIEAYRGNIQSNIRYFWWYQSFLPVMVTGPINRYPDFVREIQRRRRDPLRSSSAIERIIYGYGKVVIVGNYLINTKINNQLELLESQSIFYKWLGAAADWAYLFAQFSGWSDIAIGFALLMGIKINENFNRPFLARNLIDFWQRWHISLSLWCKDYVFTPVMAISRNPFFAVIAAMLAMGIWHALSAHYIMWGIYHGTGIALCRFFQNRTGTAFTSLYSLRVWPIVAWMLTLGFIITGDLVIEFLDGMVSSNG